MICASLTFEADILYELKKLRMTCDKSQYVSRNK